MGIQPHQLEALGIDYEEPPQLTRNWKLRRDLRGGKSAFSIRHCPGHTSGHVVLAEENEKEVIRWRLPILGVDRRTDLPGAITIN